MLRYYFFRDTFKNIDKSPYVALQLVHVTVAIEVTPTSQDQDIVQAKKVW